MENQFICHRCGKKYKSKFWYEIHLKRCKSILWTVIYTIGFIIGILAFIIASLNLYLYINDRIDPKPYMSIDKVIRHLQELEQGKITIDLTIENKGKLSGKITEVQLEFINEKPTVTNTKSMTLVPGGTTIERIYLWNDEIYQPHILRYRIYYEDGEQKLNKKKMHYCVEYFYRYLGEPHKRIGTINSTMC